MNILCALDPNDDGFSRVLETAERLCGPDDMLYVVHVLAPPLRWYNDAGRSEDEWIDAERQRTSRLIQSRLHGVKGKLLMPVGSARNPGEEVVGIAKERSADLVVVGTHGRTGLTAIALGSVAERIVRLAPCDVYVVRTAG